MGEPAVVTGRDLLIASLEAEMDRQDSKHGRFIGTKLGRTRLALACIADELREAEQAWREERNEAEWDEARREVLQVAAVAMRALRDAFVNPVVETDPDRAAKIAACPTPVYHETHRYCPSCPWTEADG